MEDSFFGLDPTTVLPKDVPEKLAHAVHNLHVLLGPPELGLDEYPLPSWMITHSKLTVANRLILDGKFAQAFEHLLTAVDTFITWKYIGGVSRSAKLINVWVDIEVELWGIKSLTNQERQAITAESIIELKSGIKMLLVCFGEPMDFWSDLLHESRLHFEAAKHVPTA